MSDHHSGAFVALSRITAGNSLHILTTEFTSMTDSGDSGLSAVPALPHHTELLSIKWRCSREHNISVGHVCV